MEKRTESKETERVKERDRFIYHRDEPVAYLQRGSKIQFEIFPTSRGGSRIHLNIYSKKKKKKNTNSRQGETHSYDKGTRVAIGFLFSPPALF